MAGIEVAGLILGAIPLVISAMEHYADGVSTIQRYMRYQREVEWVVCTLQTEKVKLANTCDRLLVGLADPSQIEDMLDDPLGKLWHDPFLQRDLKTRLWRSEDVFRATVSDVYAAIQEIHDKLGLVPGGRAPRLGDGSAIRRQLKRLSFSLRKNSVDRLLARIKDGIASLETLTTQNLALEKSRKIRSQSRYMALLRQSLKSVYRALQHGLSVRCTNAHALHLALEARPAYIIPHDDDETVSQDLSFSLVVSTHPEEGASAAALSCRHVKVQRMAAAAPPSPSTSLLPLHSPSPAPRAMKSSLTSVTKKAGRRQKTVSFLGHDIVLSRSRSTSSSLTTASMSSATSSTSTASPQGTLLPQAAISIGSAAACLCGSLSSAQENSLACYGLVEDPSDGRKYVVCSPNEHKVQCESPAPPVTLRQILAVQENIVSVSTKESAEGKAAAARLPVPRHRDRLALAMAVSSGVLQLHATPWLDGRPLTCDDILFLDRSHRGEGSSSGTPLYKHAYVTASVPGRLQPDAASSGASIAVPGAGPAGAAGAASSDSADAGSGSGLILPRLGVLLVELLLGRVVDGSARTCLEAESVFAAAEKLLGEVLDKGGINYRAAVQWCLNQYGCEREMEDEKYQQDVCKNVLMMLEENCEDPKNFS